MDPLVALRGDKVILKSKGFPSVRGVIEALHDTAIAVRLESGDLKRCTQEEIVNYSLAARKAWKRRPNRRVGRPPGRVSDRVSVTLRIDRQLWERFQREEQVGAIQGRTVTINRWLREQLDALERSGA